MTDLHDKLADALREHEPNLRFPYWPDYLADVVLSLPDIAIAQLPDTEPDLADMDEKVIGFLSRRYHPNVLAAALLAAANATEATP